MTDLDHTLYLNHLQALDKRDAELREQQIALQRKLNDAEIERVIIRHEYLLDQRPWQCAQLSLARRVDIVLGIYSLKLADFELPKGAGVVPDVYANTNYVAISFGIWHFWRQDGLWKAIPEWGKHGEYKNAMDWADQTKGIKLSQPEAICAWLGCCKAMNLNPTTGAPK
jgi:hypothetical protein